MTEEEKYELIKLSDLNREDNIKYISSEAQGIAITLDSDRYAPTFCKLERAYICGRRKSEKQIEELKERLEGETNHRIQNFNKAIEWKEKHRELEKENAELKEKLNFSTQYYLGEKAKDQLTKAKELLNEFMRISKASDEDFEHDYSELIGETEQFLGKVK